MTIPLYEELDPSPADIAMRLCELSNDEYVIAPFEEICLENYGYLRFDLEHIMHFICAELPLDAYDGEEYNTAYFSADLLVIHDIVRGWLCDNIEELKAFSICANNTIHIIPLQNGAYKVSSLSKITRADGNRYLPSNLSTPETKKRKMLLAAVAALRHERSAEIAYLNNDLAAFAVHFSHMWRSYTRLATYPALHDGRALKGARVKGANSPKASRRRNAIEALLKKKCPRYLNEDITYPQIWEKVCKGLGHSSKVTDCYGYKFWFDPKNTESAADEISTDGEINEILPSGKPKPIGFSGFSRAIRLLRKLREIVRES